MSYKIDSHGISGSFEPGFVMIILKSFLNIFIFFQAFLYCLNMNIKTNCCVMFYSI